MVCQTGRMARPRDCKTEVIAPIRDEEPSWCLVPSAGTHHQVSAVYRALGSTLARAPVRAVDERRPRVVLVSERINVAIARPL